MSITDNGTKPRAALLGTKLPLDLEHILQDPVMDKAISYAAKKDRIGWNPFLKYSSEQLHHLYWHLDDWLIGPTNVFRRGAAPEEPERKYRTPKEFLKDSKNYLLNLGVDIPYHIRSFFWGTDEGKWQKSKTFTATLLELPLYLRRVKDKIIFDAKKMKATDIARKYLKDMSQTRIDTSIDPPGSLQWTREQARRLSSKFEIIVSGMDAKTDGKSTAERLKEGGFLIHQNHPSLTQLYLNFLVFERYGLDNVITIAGNNLVNNMDNTTEARALMEKLRNSGVIFIERSLGSGNSGGYLYNSSLEEYFGYLFERRFNGHMYSNKGREKLTNEPDSSNSIVLAARKARGILIMSYSYDSIPDDHELATIEENAPHAAFTNLFRMGGSGRVWINVGQPISTAHYFDRLKSADSPKELEKMMVSIRKQIQADFSYELKKLTILPPSSIYAEAAKQLLESAKHSKAHTFKFQDALGIAYTIIRDAQKSGLSLPMELQTGSGFLPEMEHGAKILVERGAFTMSGDNTFTIFPDQKPLLDFYAAKIEPSLTLVKR
jgi:hypothetical protein